MRPELKALLRDVEAVLEEEAAGATGATGAGAGAGRARQVWAVRAGADPFLDLARAAFQRATDAIQALAARLRASDAALAGLRAKYTRARGWHFALPQPKTLAGRGGAAFAAAAAPQAPALPKCARGGRGFVGDRGARGAF